MELYIDGRQLHIAKGDVSFNFSNIRFSEAVADEWSTDVDLVNDEWNISLLDCYGLLDRGAVFKHKVECSVDIDGIARDGYIQVLNIKENIINVRVFIISIPYSILDKKVSDYFPYNDVVYRWDRFSPIMSNIAGTDIGFFPYDYTATDFYSNFIAQWHTSVNVGKILDNIQAAEDITLPAVDNVLFELSARKKVCPSNPFQVMQGNFLHSNAVSDKNLEVCGGQHITNDFKSSWSYADLHWNYNWTDWLYESTNEKWMENAKKADKITFNRTCTAHIKLYACASHIGGIIIPRKNGVNLASAAASSVPVLTSPMWTEGDILIFDNYVTFNDGDEFTLHYSGSAQTHSRNVRYSIVIEYENYTWDEKDYDVDLEYIPAPFGIWGIRDVGSDWAYDFKHDFNGTGNGTHSLEDYSFTYFGAYTNLNRDITVREYLTNLCWIHNRKLFLDRDELIFQPARKEYEIDANITEISPTNDKLGQMNIITYRDSDSPVKFEIENEFLDTEVSLHENIFYTGDIIPQYSYDMTYNDTPNGSGNQWVTDINVNFEDLSPVIMTAVYNGNTYTMKRAPELLGMGLTELTNAQTITAQTLDRINDADYVYIYGHKYMVVQGDEDAETGITEFSAIQCDYDTMGCIPPAFAIMQEYIYDNSVTVVYSLADFSGDAYGIYSLTLEGATVASGTLSTGVDSITFTGLQPKTTYMLNITIDSKCGKTFESHKIITSEQLPPVVYITDAYNITDTGVTIQFTITEN